MGAWSPDSKSHVAHMEGDDFYGSEQSHVVPFDVKESSTHKDAGVVRIEFVGEDGTTKILKNKTPLQPGEVIDSSKMDVAALREFYAKEIDSAKASQAIASIMTESKVDREAEAARERELAAVSIEQVRQHARERVFSPGRP